MSQLESFYLLFVVGKKGQRKKLTYFPTQTLLFLIVAPRSVSRLNSFGFVTRWSTVNRTCSPSLKTTARVSPAFAMNNFPFLKMETCEKKKNEKKSKNEFSSLRIFFFFFLNEKEDRMSTNAVDPVSEMVLSEVIFFWAFANDSIRHCFICFVWEWA